MTMPLHLKRMVWCFDAGGHAITPECFRQVLLVLQEKFGARSGITQWRLSHNQWNLAERFLSTDGQHFTLLGIQAVVWPDVLSTEIRAIADDGELMAMITKGIISLIPLDRLASLVDAVVGRHITYRELTA